MHAASYVFGSGGIVNQTGGWNDGIAFLFGLLSVQWTVRKFFMQFSSLTHYALADDCEYKYVINITSILPELSRIMMQQHTFRK